MFAVLAGIVFVAIMVVWGTSVVVNSRLLALFLKRVGDAPEVPIILREPGRHPEKLFYFFRSSSVPRLHAEPDLWQLRQKLKFLLVLGLVVPPAGFAMLALVALLLLRH